LLKEKAQSLPFHSVRNAGFFSLPCLNIDCSSSLALNLAHLHRPWFSKKGKLAMDRERRAQLDGILTRLGAKPAPAFDDPDQILAELKRQKSPYYPIRPDELSFVQDIAHQLNSKPTARQLPSSNDLFRIATVPFPQLAWLRLRVARQINGISHANLASSLTRQGFSLNKSQLCWRETSPSTAKKHVAIGAEGECLAQCLGVNRQWLLTGSWTDFPVDRGGNDYSLAEAAKIFGIEAINPELDLKKIPGVIILVCADTEIPRVTISDSVFFDRAVQLGLSHADDSKKIKSFHDMIALSVSSRNKVLKQTLGKRIPQNPTLLLPNWLLIYALCVQQAWGVISQVKQSISLSKKYQGMSPTSLETATASRWMNLYFFESIEPGLRNTLNSIKENPKWKVTLPRFHGFPDKEESDHESDRQKPEDLSQGFQTRSHPSLG
jgi:hypothetical protein